MTTFDEYLNTIKNEEHRHIMATVLEWVSETYPNLGKRIAWNQPMFTDHGTFIIGFSVSSKHFSVAPEEIEPFIPLIEEAGYSYGKKLFRIPFDGPIDYHLLSAIIDYNCRDKQDCQTFWRKK